MHIQAFALILVYSLTHTSQGYTQAFFFLWYRMNYEMYQLNLMVRKPKCHAAEEP